MRAANSMTNKEVYAFDQFRLNMAERTLESGGKPVSVSPKALEVLIVLIENRGRIVEKDELMRQVWPGTFVEENNLAFNISVLRKIFAESSVSPRYIETVPKRGYRFIAKEDHLLKASAPTVSRFRWRWTPIAALFALGLIGIVAFRFRGASKLADTKMLTDTETIVLADFVNKTGDPVFDGTGRCRDSCGSVLGIRSCTFLASRLRASAARDFLSLSLFFKVRQSYLNLGNARQLRQCSAT